VVGKDRHASRVEGGGGAVGAQRRVHRRVVLHSVEGDGVGEEVEEVRDGRLRVESELHVGVHAGALGAVAQPRIAARVHSLRPLQRERVADLRILERDDLARRCAREDDACAAAHKERVARLVQRPPKVVRRARVVPAEQLQERLPEDVGVIVHVHVPLGLLQLRPVRAHGELENGLHLEAQPRVPRHALVMRDRPVLALRRRPLRQVERRDAVQAPRSPARVGGGGGHSIPGARGEVAGQRVGGEVGGDAPPTVRECVALCRDLAVRVVVQPRHRLAPAALARRHDLSQLRLARHHVHPHRLGRERVALRLLPLHQLVRLRLAHQPAAR